VDNGWLTLEGNVEWNYQREAAGRAVRYLLGVVGVTNAIGMSVDASSALVEERVKAALQRQATSDANTILIGTSGGTVTLRGKASSWQAIEDAAAAAWAAPGVTKVIDTVAMSPD
jgi:osmotically-inducible protein OsmY